MSNPTNLQENVNEKHKGIRFWHWVLLFACLTLAVFLVERNATDFLASVIPVKQSAPFDGTTLPVLKAPRWTALTTEQYKAAYDSIPAAKLMDLPKYDPAVLRSSTESLGWKTESDLNIRNAKITFSTPYMGNYKLDGLEYAGNHPAVDIKIPDGTPIYAIANGIVTKSVSQTTGYGQHIVIRHDNVPSLDNADKKVTLYSSYNHLSEISIAEGDVVTKGQLIGKSGHTGTATTPHIHFQIDTADAPWHPYWPFTYQEASAAGLSFFEAVNAGLNADKAKAVTINPMLYVQKYLSYSGGATSPSTPAITTPVTTPAATETVTPPTTPVTDPIQPVIAPEPASVTDNTVEETTTDTASYASNADKYVLENDGSFVENVPEEITIKAVDVNGDTVKGYKPKDYVYLLVELGGAEMPDYLRPADFADGQATFKVTPKGKVSLQIKATDGILSGISSIMQASLFSDLTEESANYKAVSFLRKHGVLGGYPDGTFKPENVVSRVEALKFILGGANSRLITDAELPFKDTKVSEWYSDYVATGYSKNIVAGYKDSTFKPTNTVNRAEFLKMLISAMEVKINPIVTRDLYKDVSKDAWYAPYVRYAKETNIMDADGQYFRPEEGMTRGEVAETIYRMVMLKLNEADQYDTGMTVSATEASKYFS